MRSHVFTDAALAKHAGRFVWLSIDTEKSANAAFVEKFPIENWPTLLVIDSSGEKPVFKWPGSATVPQLEKMFADAETALMQGAGSEATPAARLAKADRLNAQRKYAEAATLYEGVLASAPKDFDRRSRVVESLALALYQSKRYADCAGAVVREVAALARGPSFANAAAMGLFCSLSMPGDEGKARAKELKPFAFEALRLEGILADDRSGLFDALIEQAENEADDATAKALSQEWFAFLHAQRRAATTPDARAAFDPHMVSAALKINAPERAVPLLVESERALPEDYNAPARLALLYRATGEFDLAMAAHDRAIAKAYGPRRLLVMEQKAQTQVKRGDVAGARSTYEAAKALSNQMPKSLAVERALMRIDKAMTAL